MTESDIIDGLLQREAGWRDQVTRPNGTIDYATNKGITIVTLRNWRRRSNPSAVVTEQTLRDLTDTEAAAIYRSMFVIEPGFVPANIPFEPLRVQLIDFGVNSGPPLAIRWLQRVLGVAPEDVDGVFGPVTRAWLDAGCKSHALAPRWINDALVAARSYSIDSTVDQGVMRKQDEEGVESRALSFFLAKP